MLEENLRDIKNQYHEILRSNPKEAIRAYEKLLDLMMGNKIIYNGKPIPVLLEPGFFPFRVRRELEKVFDPIQKGIDRIINIVLERNETNATDKGLEKVFSLIRKTITITPEERELMKIYCGTERNVCIYRLDLYLNGGFQILEFNSDSAGGIIEADVQTKLFLQLSTIRKLKTSYILEEAEGARLVLNALLDSKYSSKKEGYRPTICLTDWRDVESRIEQENLIKYFQNAGYNALFVDPRDFEYRNGQLLYRDKKIDIVHRRVILKELIEKKNEAKAVIEAASDRAVSVINPFASAIGSNKAILAVLSDKRFRKAFDEDTWRVMERHLPWTRVVHQLGQDGMKEVYNNKDTFVLKQCRSYGGKAVVVGYSATEDEWKRKVGEINERPGEPWVVQRYIKRPRQIYPISNNGKLEFKEMVFNFNPFIINGNYGCGIVRLSPPDQYIINVSRGGAQTPMIDYKPL